MSYWTYYKEFEIKTNNASESYNNKINKIFEHKRTFIYHTLYKYRNMIKDSLDNYTKNIMNHSIQEVIKYPLRNNTIKNIIDKYERY